MIKQDNLHNWLKQRLSDERYSHVIGAEKCARTLAERFGIDTDLAGFAALIHDNAKCFTNDELIQMIKDYEIPVTDSELNCFKTWHAPVGAYLARQDMGVENSDILNAVRYHTVGRVNMSMLEKIVFLADKIEENTRCPEFISRIKKVLDKTENIDEALIICYDVTIRSLLDRKLFINTQTIDVYNELLLKSGK